MKKLYFIIAAASARHFPPVRHSRESGNLPNTGTTNKQGIPACAGMTLFFAAVLTFNCFAQVQHTNNNFPKVLKQNAQLSQNPQGLIKLKPEQNPQGLTKHKPEQNPQGLTKLKPEQNLEGFPQTFGKVNNKKPNLLNSKSLVWKWDTIIAYDTLNAAIQRFTKTFDTQGNDLI